MQLSGVRPQERRVQSGGAHVIFGAHDHGIYADKAKRSGRRDYTNLHHRLQLRISTRALDEYPISNSSYMLELWRRHAHDAMLHGHALTNEPFIGISFLVQRSFPVISVQCS